MQMERMEEYLRKTATIADASYDPANMTSKNRFKMRAGSVLHRMKSHLSRNIIVDDEPSGQLRHPRYMVNYLEEQLDQKLRIKGMVDRLNTRMGAASLSGQIERHKVGTNAVAAQRKDDPKRVLGLSSLYSPTKYNYEVQQELHETDPSRLLHDPSIQHIDNKDDHQCPKP